MALVRNGSELKVIDPITGERRDSFTLKSPAMGLLTGYVGDSPAVLGYSADEVVMWTDSTHSTRFDLQEGQSVVSRSGQLFITSGTFAELLSKSGPTPFLQPREGVSLFGASPAGMVRWASARGTIVTGDLTGGILSETALAAPVEDATVSGWVATVNDVTVTRWDSPGGTVLATHNTSSGAVIATAPATVSGAAALYGDDRAVVIVDGQRISLSDGTITALPAGFVPSLFLGSTVFGATDEGTAVLAGGTVTAVDTPQVIPVAATPRTLLATSGDHLLGFSRSTGRPTGAASTPTTGGTSK